MLARLCRDVPGDERASFPGSQNQLGAMKLFHHREKDSCLAKVQSGLFFLLTTFKLPEVQ